MSLKKTVGKRLREGFKILGYDFRLDIQNEKELPKLTELLIHHNRKLLSKFPELEPFAHSSIEKDVPSCLAFSSFANACIPHLEHGLPEVYLRNMLVDLGDRAASMDYRDRIQIQIGLSRVREGICDPASFLLETPGIEESHPEAISKVRADLEEYDRENGAEVAYMEGHELWKNTNRGICLVQWFEKNNREAEKKDILHVAPEPELEEWFRTNAKKLGATYHTFDGVRADVDLNGDLSEMRIEDEHYDLIICHRVLEHILDDRAAMENLYRALKPGGALNVSVPQALQNEKSIEWFVPDRSLHGHMRHYGRDFVQRLESVGFQVRLDRTFLDKSYEEHQRDRTAPLRFYEARK